MATPLYPRAFWSEPATPDRQPAGRMFHSLHPRAMPLPPWTFYLIAALWLLIPIGGPPLYAAAVRRAERLTHWGALSSWERAAACAWFGIAAGAGAATAAWIAAFIGSCAVA